MKTIVYEHEVFLGVHPSIRLVYVFLIAYYPHRILCFSVFGANNMRVLRGLGLPTSSSLALECSVNCFFSKSHLQGVLFVCY